MTDRPRLRPAAAAEGLLALLAAAAAWLNAAALGCSAADGCRRELWCLQAMDSTYISQGSERAE
jgi:hypothetical protein